MGSRWESALLEAEARKYILASYAGLEAQRLVDSSPLLSRPSDDENAFEMSRRYRVWGRGVGAIGDAAHRAYLKRLRLQSRARVGQLSHEIKVLAAALRERKTLTAEEVRGLFKSRR